MVLAARIHVLGIFGFARHVVRRDGVRVARASVRRRRRLAVEVGVDPGQDVIDVRGGVVVAIQRGAQAGFGAQIAATGAQVSAGGERRVPYVVRVRNAVTVGVRAEPSPRAGDELHRTDGTVPHDVPVPRAVVRIGDRRNARAAVEHRSDDCRHGHTCGVELTAAGMA